MGDTDGEDLVTIQLGNLNRDGMSYHYENGWKSKLTSVDTTPFRNFARWIYNWTRFVCLGAYDYGHNGVFSFFFPKSTPKHDDGCI
jgi:hypothetical protein